MSYNKKLNKLFKALIIFVIYFLVSFTGLKILYSILNLSIFDVVFAKIIIILFYVIFLFNDDDFQNEDIID